MKLSTKQFDVLVAMHDEATGAGGGVPYLPLESNACVTRGNTTIRALIKVGALELRNDGYGARRVHLTDAGRAAIVGAS